MSEFLEVNNLEDCYKILNHYGVCIYKNILNEEECNRLNFGIASTFEHLTSNYNIPFKINDQKTWRSLSSLNPKHGMLHQHYIGHAQCLWDVRTNQKIIDVFSSLYGTKDLLVSFDGLSFSCPPEVTNLGWQRDKWFHCDQSFTKSEDCCIQGYVNGFDANEKDSSLCVLLGSNHYHQEYRNTFNINDKEDWYKFDNVDFYLNKGCYEHRLITKKGDLVLWNSKTIHYGGAPIKRRKIQNFRTCAYISYMPKNSATQKDLIKRQNIFSKLRMTSHWANKPKMFPEHPRTYGKEVEKINPLPKPIIDQKYMYLIGY